MSVRQIPDDESMDAREAVAVVLRNWRDELRTLFATELFQRAETIVRVLPGTVEIHRIQNGLDDTIGVVPCDQASEKSCTLELARVMDRSGVGSDVVLVLPADNVLRLRLTMPRSTRAALHGALRYEIERISPINQADLYYDFVALSSKNDNLEIELRIVRKNVLDEAVALCGAAGLSVAGLRFEDDSQPADWRCFPVDQRAFARNLWRRFGSIALAGLAALLVLAVLLGAYTRETAKLDALTEAVIDAGTRAARVERTQQLIDRTAKDLALPILEKRSPLVISTLAELTQILPDGTWITELTLDGSKVRIEGSSSSASDLIGLIDRSGKFANAHFEAPLVHDQTANVDRFDLSFEIRGP